MSPLWCLESQKNDVNCTAVEVENIAYADVCNVDARCFLRGKTKRLNVIWLKLMLEWVDRKDRHYVETEGLVTLKVIPF
jgi:hypothetical protein